MLRKQTGERPRAWEDERKDVVAALREAAGPAETQDRVLLHSTLMGWADAFERGDHEGASARAEGDDRVYDTDAMLKALAKRGH